MCGSLVIGNFVWQFLVCPKCSGDAKACLLDVKDTIEIKRSTEEGRQMFVAGASTTFSFYAPSDFDLGLLAKEYFL